MVYRLSSRMRLLLVLLLSCLVVTGSAWKGCHDDQDKDQRMRVNCTALGFSALPAGFEPVTQVFLLPRNQFSSLSWSSFQIFTNIHELDFTANQIPEVTPSDTPVLPSLSVLRLSSNRLTLLPEGSFSACPGLTELYLDHNTLESLSDLTFSGLSRLEILDLSSNRLTSLPNLMLRPLVVIETLYLENNKVTGMPNDWFRPREEVPYLYLSENPWACSCSLSYLHGYLNNYEDNVYFRVGPVINFGADRVICDSPRRNKNKPLMTLKQSDLCPEAEGEDQLMGGPHLPNTPPPTSSAGPGSEVSELPRPDVPTKAALAEGYTETPPSTAPPSNALPNTAPPFTAPPTTAPPSNALPNTAPPFTAPPTTVPPSTAPPTTAAPFTAPPSTAPPFTAPPTTVPPSTAPPTTAPPFTAPLTIVPPSNAPPTTSPLTTAHPFTAPSTTASPHSVPPPALVATPTWPRSEPEWSEDPGSEVRGELPVERPAETNNQTTTCALTPPSASGGNVPPVRGAGGFCLWLLAGGLLLSVGAAACVLTTLVRLIVWYRRVYRPMWEALAKRRASVEVGRLLPIRTMGGREVAGGGGGVKALYRSVLFVQREGGTTEMAGGAVERGGEEGGATEMVEEGGKQPVLVTLEPRRGRRGEGAAREVEGREEKGVYRKTLYRLCSKEEDLEGWSSVMEECRVSADEGGRGCGGETMGGGGVSRKCYSVILREKTEEAGGGREDVDWVVGGWEVKRGGGWEGEEEGPSWGEWLVHYLPSMPWSVTTPPENLPSQRCHQ
ncbi:platelet glycoprotein Ib alpha chain [Pungitius pungitius]|uniref:platelet glycoprotein Ib alpha chain n=1 Tax=Pungitius pungitius TaxID=134920 RepID=UPI002E0F2BCC